MGRRTKQSIELENKSLKRRIVHLQSRVEQNDAEEQLGEISETLQSLADVVDGDMQKLLDIVSERVSVYQEVRDYATDELHRPEKETDDVASELISLHRDLGEAFGESDPIEYIHTRLLKSGRIGASASEADALEALYSILEEL